MKTKFSSAAKAAARLAQNPKVEKRVKAEILRSSFVGLLLEMRVNKGLTQEQVAKSMQCDASVISRIESGNDRLLKWSDIVGYCRALKVEMNILFVDPSIPAADRIKQCVFKIDEDLKSLANLAQQVGAEDKISNAISRFYQEVLFDFLARYKNNHSQLPAVVKVPDDSNSSPFAADETEHPGKSKSSILA